MSIGDSYGGGIVAYILVSGDPGYIDDGKQRGLIAAVANISAGIVWHATQTGTTGATGTALGTGSSNTDAIIALHGAENNAATISRNYSAAGDGGLGDWFLPSKDELWKLYLNRAAIGGFVSGRYWSSTEYSSSSAWFVYFTFGTVDKFGKDFAFPVRCVRNFTYLAAATGNFFRLF